MFGIDPGPREVAAGFWIGGLDARLRPPRAGWSLIVNCTHERYETDTRLIHCAIQDGDAWAPDHLDSIYQEITDHLAQQPGETLIHCFAGVSRSVSMSVYALTRMGVFMTPHVALEACRYSPRWYHSPKSSTVQSVLDALQRLDVSRDR